MIVTAHNGEKVFEDYYIEAYGASDSDNHYHVTFYTKNPRGVMSELEAKNIKEGLKDLGKWHKFKKLKNELDKIQEGTQDAE